MMRKAVRYVFFGGMILLPGMAAGEIVMNSSQATGAGFKRIKVSDTIAGKRITVQIDPAEQARMLAALPKVDPNPAQPPAEPLAPTPAAPAASSYAWFWDVIPVQKDQAAGRFPAALACRAVRFDSRGIRFPGRRLSRQPIRLFL